MNREFLKGLGLTDEQIDSVMKEHGKTINDTKEKADKVDSLESQIEDYKQQLEERDNQLNELSEKAKGNEELTNQINELKEQNEQTKTEYEQRLESQQKDFAIVNYLRDQKVKDPDLLKVKLDLEAITYKDGKLIGIDEQVNPLKESHDYLFEQEEGSKGPTIVAPGNPNGGGGKPNPFSKEHWNLTEQGKIFREDPELYKQLKAQAGK